MPEETHKRSLWLGIIERAVTIGLTIIIAAFFLGGKREKLTQKVGTLESDMAAWKEEWKAEHKHITAMDLEGSVATKNFIAQYDKEQAKQYEMLKELQSEVKHLEAMKAQLDRLERKIGDPPKP
jgi:hypothetical protein